MEAKALARARHIAARGAGRPGVFAAELFA